MLWAFDLAEVPGQPIDLNEYDGASGRSPVPFEVVLRIRSEENLEVIENSRR
jgi:hypothetical protein